MPIFVSPPINSITPFYSLHAWNLFFKHDFCHRQVFFNILFSNIILGITSVSKKLTAADDNIRR